MKIALISDIHGNYTALKEVLNKINDLCIDKIYCLGDVVGYYSEINECCEALRNLNVKSIMGNHDWYMITKSRCPRSKSVNDCLDFQRKIITEDNFRWLSSLPHFIYECGILMVHGGLYNPLDEYIEPTSEYFANTDMKYIISGHTHVQMIRKLNDKLYCNPGSVGQPRDNNPHAAFATFDGKRFEMYRVPYDVERVGYLMEKAGFSGYYYGCLRTGSKNLTW